MKNIAKISVIIILLSLISSCTWVGTTKSIKSFDENNKVDSSQSFYLIYPKKGFEKAFITQELVQSDESAMRVTDVFRNSSQLFGELIIGERNLDLESGFKEAKLRGSKYLIDINISEWKDAFYMMCQPTSNRYGHMQGPVTLDTVDLTIFIYDTQNKSLLNKQRIENRGCPIVFAGLIPIGKNSPEGRLKPMLPEWLNNVKQ